MTESEVSRLKEHIAHLKTLRDGWFDGLPCSKGIPHDELDWLQEAIIANCPPDLPKPYVFPLLRSQSIPMPKGGVLLEWDADYPMLQILFHDRSGCLCGASDQIVTLDMNDPASWTQLFDSVRKFVGTTNEDRM